MTKQEAIQRAVEQLSKPEVHYQVLLASSPDVAMDIVESLPGVKELVQIGPEAAGTVLDLLRTDGTTAGENLSTIALYLLHHISTPETTRALAEMVVADKFTGLNRQLAAETFLQSAGIQFKQEEGRGEDAVEVAYREAKNSLGSQSSPEKGS